MALRLRMGLGLALSTAVLAAWAQPSNFEPAPLEPPPQVQREMPAKPIETLKIGVLKGLPRPEGFVVEDLRKPDMMAKTHFKETYRAPFSPFKRPVPLAKYERAVGEGELNVSPIELFAEKLIETYGDRLKGKQLKVYEFSYRLEQLINKPQGMNYTVVGSGSLAADIALSLIGSAVGTAMMQGKGIDLRLHVRIDAELDGKRIEAKEDPMNIGTDGPARITRYAIEKFQYRYDPPPAEPEQAEQKAEEKTEEAKKD